MAKKTYIYSGKTAATAIAEAHPAKPITVSDERALAEIHQLIEERKRLGIRLSQQLISQGLACDDDEPTVTDC